MTTNSRRSTTQIVRAGLALLALAAGCTDSCQCDERSDAPPPVERAEDARTVELTEAQAVERLWPARPPRYIADPLDRGAALAQLLWNASHRIDDDVDVEYIDRLAKRAGFAAEYWKVGDHRYLAFIERPEHRSGAGSYVLRLGPRGEADREFVVQAPHSFFDLGTGKIAAALFFHAGAEARALFVNTQHRYMQADGRIGALDDNPADVCHNIDHPFAFGTEAIARGLEDAEVIQIHGFDRKQILGNPYAIVSASDPERSSPRSIALADRLQTGFEVRIARFPEDTLAMGATANVEAARLRNVFGASFIHVELSKELRDLAVADRHNVEKLATALFGDPPATYTSE